ncbi:transposase [Nannocystis pusilla]|uniref:transposase n=1 Tax=Nannocystis pusilla TaxID=889268 RepID=UPI003B8315FE
MNPSRHVHRRALHLPDRSCCSADRGQRRAGRRAAREIPPDDRAPRRHLARVTRKARAGAWHPARGREAAPRPSAATCSPRRWVVERSLAWTGLSRRLARDLERLPETLAGLRVLAFVVWWWQSQDKISLWRPFTPLVS